LGFSSQLVSINHRLHILLFIGSVFFFFEVILGFLSCSLVLQCLFFLLISTGDSTLFISPI
jgi:hypothetical protein